MTLYQNNWANTGKISGAFDVDESIGKNLTFRLEVTKGNQECQKDMIISLIEPNLNRTDYKFRCSKANYGTYVNQLKDVATAGRWQFLITSTESFESLSVRVTSRSRNMNDDPIQTKCWIKTGEQQLGADVYLKLSAVAEVKKGNMPVIGARVRAYITRPGDSGSTPPLEMELSDNGSGADVIKNDGIYSRIFTKYQGTGRYSVKCEVIGSNETQINEGFIVSRALPEKPGAPICCGSNAVTANSKLTSSGNFTRQSVGGSFQAKQGDIPSGDKYPPSRVTDLKLVNSCGRINITFTSPGDDYDSPDKVKQYIIKYSQNATNLVNFDSALLPELSDDDLIHNGTTLNPVVGGQLVNLELNSTLFENGIVYSFGMIASDESNNRSPISVIAKLVGGNNCNNGSDYMTASILVLILSTILSFTFQ